MYFSFISNSVNYIGINKILDSETTPWHGQASEKHRVKIRFTVIGTTHETIAESETDEIKMSMYKAIYIIMFMGVGWVFYTAGAFISCFIL